MSSIWCRWFGIGCPPKPTPAPVPPTPPAPVPEFKAVAVVVFDAAGPVVGASVALDGNPNPYPFTNRDGYTLVNNVPYSLTASQLTVSKSGYLPYSVHVDLPNHNDTLSVTLTLAVKPLPAPPTRDEILGVKISFQGLVVNTAQFGKLPWFEAALAWLTPEDRAAVYAAKKVAGDTHCIVHLPCGPALYDEANQPYSADRFGPLDFTGGNTKLDARFSDLLREVIGQGFKVMLFLGGDGPEGFPIGMKQLDLLKADADYSSTLWKYCVVIPGWDSVFYGWEPVTKIVDFGLKFREIFPSGYLGLEYNCGHIPIGEGGADYLPRTGDPHSNPGRMADFDLILGEFADNLHQDSTWQILNRLEPHYVRPADQPSGDDPARVFYLGTPNPRGRFYHLAFEYGEYEFVRGGCSQASVDHVNANRAYMKSMGVEFTG